MLKAFLVGGLICTLGQGLIQFYLGRGLPREDAATATSMTLVFLGALLTGLGVYDDIGRFAGAGTLVPITGFANSVVSPALEFKREGWVAGTAAKMFTIAGPVIVYGIGSSVAYGLILSALHLV
jgi:stage V sporulation protein AC